MDLTHALVERELADLRALADLRELADLRALADRGRYDGRREVSCAIRVTSAGPLNGLATKSANPAARARWTVSSSLCADNTSAGKDLAWLPRTCSMRLNPSS